MKVLYITYTDLFKEGNSGSKVRPMKIYQAFIRRGYSIKVLEGEQRNFAERRKKVKSIINWLDSNNVDYCYIESPSGPIFNKIDLYLIKLLHKRKIKIGFFYRDAHWLLLDDYMMGKPLKKAIIQYMNIRELKVLRDNVDVIYMPSETMINLFLDKNKILRNSNLKVSKPGTDIEIKQNNRLSIQNTGIYVGGVSKFYGTDLLIDSFKKINENGIKCKLILVCRKEEFLTMFPKGLDYKWLTVYHKDRSVLLDLYKKADFGIIPIRKGKYQDMAVPIKLVEYISYGLPILTTDIIETKKIVEEYNLGIVEKDSIDDFCSGIEKIISDIEGLKVLQNNVTIAKEALSWDNNVLQFEHDLI